MSKGLQLNGVPFTNLRIAYFKSFDIKGEKIFLDATDEQILKSLCREFSETTVILRIEDIEVLEVITRIPDKRKLDESELKHGITEADKLARAVKIERLRQQYPNT